MAAVVAGRRWGARVRCGALCASLLVACTDSDVTDGGFPSAGVGSSAGAGSGGTSGSGPRAGTAPSASGAGASAGRSGNGGAGASGGGGRVGSAGSGTGGDAQVEDRDAGMTGMDAAQSPADAGRVFSTDRDDFFGASRCPSSGVLLCEDFESETVGAGPDSAVWTVRGGAPQIDDARAARGSKSLHVHTQTNGFSLIEETKTFPAANNTFYGRMFVYVDALPTAPQWAHWTLVAGNGEGDGSEIRVGGQWDGQRNRFGVGTDHGATGDWTNLDEDPSAQAAAVPEDEWLCVEWLYDGDANEMRFYWDGVEHPSLHASENDHGGNQGAAYVLPQFQRVALGWWLYQSGSTPDHFDLWLDEIIIDDEPIGCVL